MMADPITGQRKWLSHVDGVGNSFEYYAQIIPDNITTVIEIKKLGGWKKLDGQGL